MSCVPSGAHTFYGLVVYGFTSKQLSCPTSVSDFFTSDLIYVIIYIVFIYSFIYSVTSFPVESWASMPYEHREKPKTYILYECTQDTMCHVGRTFLASHAVNYLFSLQLCWTSGPVLVG